MLVSDGRLMVIWRFLGELIDIISMRRSPSYQLHRHNGIIDIEIVAKVQHPPDNKQLILWRNIGQRTA